MSQAKSLPSRSLLFNKRTARRLQGVALAVLLAAAVWLFLSMILVPDPGGKLLFARAQSLESRGLVQPAIRQYRLLADAHATSPYAPQALLQAADLMVDQRRAGEATQFAAAIAMYERLASTYPQHLLAGVALLRTGDVLTSDLRASARARALYNRVLAEYPNNREYAAEATLRLGRVAQQERDGAASKTWYQRVLQRYPAETVRTAEAQFRLGEVYEALFTGKEHKVWARNAYEATIKNYAQTVWASKAKERLGLMVWVDTAPRERRVLIETRPLTKESSKSGSLLDALRLVLAARGVVTGDTVLRGWGMEPFYAGFAPDNPGQVVEPPFAAWENAAANAGLAAQSRRGKDAADALAKLQRELDDAHSTLVYTGNWRLVAGYDSARNEVQLQSNAARYETLAAADLVTHWKRPSPLGGAFGLLSFHTPGEVVRLKAAPVTADRSQMPAAPSPLERAATDKGATKAPAVSTRKNVEPLRSPLAAPTFVYTLEPLSERSAHQRAVRQAAIWMRRPRDEDGYLLNLAALQALAGTVKRLSVPLPAPVRDQAVPPPTGQLPVRAQDQSLVPAPGEDGLLEATPEPGVAPVEPTPQAKPTPLPAAPTGEAQHARAQQARNRQARAILAWRGAPLKRWVTARRQAAAYLDIAAVRLNAPALRRAADEFRASVAALESAAAALPASTLAADLSGPTALRSFGTAAGEIERARQAETRAADLLASI